MRQAFIQALCDEAARNPRIMLLTGDLGYRFLEPFRDHYPRQFLNVGVAESNLITVAAGLSTTGKIPFCYSIATFATMRPFENIRNDVSLQNLNVKIVGIGAGLAYTKAGPTHHSMEDIALMRLLPNTTIVAPATPKRTYEVTRALIKHIGPCYMRLERNPSHETKFSTSFSLGRACMVQKGKTLAIIVTGSKVSFAQEVSRELVRAKVNPSIFLFETIAPLDQSLLRSIAKQYHVIATIEEHRIDGGLGSGVSDFYCQQKSIDHPRLLKYGLKNEYNPVSAGYDALVSYHGFTPHEVAVRLIRFFRLKTH